MNAETMKRTVSTDDTPQRGPRTRDRRASSKQHVRRLLDAYKTGTTEEFED